MKKALLVLLGVVAGALVLLSVWLSVPVEPTITPIVPRASTQYWSMAAGYRIAYTHVPARGDSARAPIVFLHGGPGGYVHASAIETFGQLAERGYDVYLYDQVGSGLSDRLPRPKDYGFARHARDLNEIIETHLGAERAILIGQSYGGTLVSYMVATHPGLVEKAVLASPGGIEPTEYRDGVWVTEQRYPIPDSLAFRAPADVSDEMGVSSWPPRAIAAIAVATVLNRKLMPDAEADGVLNTIATRITRGMACDPAAVPAEEGGGGFYSHGWSNWFAEVDDWRPALQASPVPTLVLQGQCDYLPYAATVEHAALLPNGRYAFVEGAGHDIWWERPDALLAAITSFLDEPAPAR